MANRNERRKLGAGFIVPGVLLVAIVGILVSLGNWQMRRLSWKLDLIDKVDSRLNAEPADPPGPENWANIDADAIAYRQVRMSGRYLPGEFHVFTSLSDPKGRYGGPGYWVMTPFRTSAGWIVFVNRGFVPQDLKAASSRPGSEAPQGDLTLGGTVRQAEPEGTGPSFEAEPEKNIWYRRDPAQLALAGGLARVDVAPYTVDLNAGSGSPNGLPQAGETKVSFKNPHLGYAMTWYGLALSAIGVFAVYLMGAHRRRKAGDRTVSSA
ncbi:SURF1 family protein [Breoghania sp.]|uniref:SURF1 family protein n=1 Tax=Breoghania sp. TaxID=2065378 RepID=UPI002AA87824|nr:SURF1 family protein [Breoghania sp.]